ncbi:MAG: ATP-dependent Clp protease proteolytic subunit [Candidatus Algichlamydia australiensis]|nr:ATP-dependent Clp protease proteolytic subunit [Chlamydiales bacterium]
MSDEDEKKEKRASGTIQDKIDEMLLQHRRIFFSSPVMDDSAKEVIRKLWYLELKDPGKPILFIINSPGGSVDSGFAIWDQIKMMTSPVTTLVTGLAASMGSVLSLVAGKGRRFATPYARIMIHQPAIHGVIQGQATDLEIQAKEIIKTRKTLVDLYTSQTGQDEKAVEKALDRDTWYSAKEALEFGLLDGIVESYTDLKM